MSQLVKFGLILGAICLAATLVLAVTYEVTKPKIEAELKVEEQDALKAIIPSADSFNEKVLGGIEYFEALKDRRVIGYCIRVVGNGYNGYIRMIAGVDSNGIIQGVIVLEHGETPGLGAKINEVSQGESEPGFLKQFKGKDARNIAVKKDIDAITGATISSKAVTDAIRKTANELLTRIKK
ncbi:MAG: RnfABCDGE type electron transport complex subunit G [Candidatus Omnitrophota bacterium]|nr:RnfABCDGE type electron transport complex subunit G [Candidatus Omnitrophota bacterium]